MEILGVGIWEFFLVLLIALIVMGPENMVKTGRAIGRFIRTVVKSPMWAEMMDTSREIRELPTRIVREAGIDETMEELKQETEAISKDISAEMNATAGDLNQTLKEAAVDAALPVNPLTGEPVPGVAPVQAASSPPVGAASTAAVMTEQKPPELKVEELEGEALVYFAAGLTMPADPPPAEEVTAGVVAGVAGSNAIPSDGKPAEEPHPEEDLSPEEPEVTPEQQRKRVMAAAGLEDGSKPK